MTSGNLPISGKVPIPAAVTPEDEQAKHTTVACKAAVSLCFKSY